MDQSTETSESKMSRFRLGSRYALYVESISDTPDNAPRRTVGERRILRRREDERLVYTVAEAARLLVGSPGTELEFAL